MDLRDDSDFRIHVIVIHLSELQYLTVLPGTPTSEYDVADTMQLYLTDDVRTSVSKVSTYAEELKEEYPFYQVQTKEDQIEAIERSVTFSEAYYTALGSVTILIGMLFVVCVVIMNIAERTKEIGILRAIGISKRTIFTMFFIESLSMVFMGSIFGVLLGIFGSHYLGEYIGQSIGFERDITLVTPSLVILSIVATNVMGSLASIYPGIRASRMKIVEAMRND